jgi:ABC-type nitrate/sulfonate/bicarbonate transport system substrate-binding protein
MNVKAVAAITHGNPNVLLVPGDSPVQTIADLEGMSVAFALGGGVANEVFPQMLEENGVDSSTVEQVEVDSDLVIPSVISGQVDIGSGFRNSQFVAFQEEDPDARFITYTENGFDWLGGYGVAAGEQIIQERPDTIRAFLRGLLRAWADVDEDTAGAIEAGAIHYPENFLDADFSERQLEQTLEMLEGPETATKGLGYTAEEEWQSLIDVSADYGGLEEVLPLETYYTNEFLPEKPIMP